MNRDDLRNELVKFENDIGELQLSIKSFENTIASLKQKIIKLEAENLEYWKMIRQFIKDQSPF